MSLTNIGDMSFSLMQQTRSAALKSSMITLTQELTTGQTSDIRGRLASDYSYLTDIDQNLARLDGYAISATEAGLFSSASQQSLERIQGVISTVSEDLLTINSASLEVARLQASNEARLGLDTILSALNGSVGGRSLFAGTATDTNPMASADTMIAALQVEVAGMTVVSDILTAIDDWFADPAGFKATMYTGSDDPLSPIQVGANEQVSLSLRADDANFRNAMRNTVVAILATDSGLALDPGTQNILLREAGVGMLNNNHALTGLRADLGYAEQRIEEASARNGAARTSLSYARNELLEADPFETASRLEEVQFQLESLYAVTVRASRLSLLSFL
ncbi:MAG: flagellar biosynthesis protein FlgL [Rhodobacteraceae bacterium]|nr:flagellar biosynthesis protein FlgL [Paracoccaceae bacterium]